MSEAKRYTDLFREVWRNKLMPSRFPRQREEAFLQYYRKRTVFQTRCAILLSIILYAIFGVLDPYIVSSAMRQVWMLRYSLACPFFAFCFIVTYYTKKERYIQWLVSLAAIVGGCGIAVMMVLDKQMASKVYYGGIMLVIMCQYAFARLQFFYATISGWFILLFYLVTALFFRAAPGVFIMNNMFFLVSANLMGMWIAYILEVYIRNEYDYSVMMLKNNRQLRRGAIQLEAANRGLRESERKLHNVIYGSPVPSFFIDKNHRVIHWNKALEDISGFRSEQVIGTQQYWKPFYDKQTPCMADLLVDGTIEQVPEWHAGKYKLSGVVEGGYEATEFFPSLRGRGKWLYLTAVAIRDAHGDVMGAMQTLEDITDRRMAMEMLRESQDRYRVLLESISVGFLVYDREWRVMMINDAGIRMAGVPREEIIGRRFSDLFPASEETVFFKTYQEVMETRQPAPAISGEFIWKDGRRGFYEAHTYPVPEGIAVITTDITERKKAEEELRQAYEQLKSAQAQLVQSEKMASVGQLAAGIAHEINNPTSFVLSNISSLKKYLESLTQFINACSKECAGSTTGQRLELLKKELDINYILDDLPKISSETLEGAQRIKKIVQDLRNFAHPGENGVQAVDVNQTLESTLNLIWNEIKYKAQVVKEYGEVPAILANGQELSQILLNIILNAAQAINQQGTITIKTFVQNGFVRIDISDTGSGIPTEILPKIFDPFFTTKPIGKGTGLGLSIAHGIVQKYKGSIDVKSKPGEGTTFTITFPIRPQAV